MSVGTTPNRASQPPRRNDAWQSLEQSHHARSQSEMVDIIVRERNKGRTGLKTQELGFIIKEDQYVSDESPAAKIHKMTLEELKGFFLATLKRYRVIQRFEAYKDARLIDEDYFDQHANHEHQSLSQNVYKNLLHLSDRLALEMIKESVAGVDVDAEGNLYVYYMKAKDVQSLGQVAKGGRGKKKSDKEEKDKEEVEVGEMPSAIKIHYLID